MKYLKYLATIALAALTLLSMLSSCAPAPAPTQAPSPTPPKTVTPQVPINYPGDTDKTIARRAEWIAKAKNEGTLVWWGTLTLDQGKGVMAEFNKIYPFITIDYWNATGEEMASKMEAEFTGGRNKVDICLGGEPANYPRWRKIGMMEKFTDIIPQIDKIDKRMYSKNADWAQPGNIVTSPQYNTKLVSAAEAPKKWEDLLDPKWKGRLGITTDMKVWNVLALAEGGWGVEKTEQFLSKLKEQNLIWGRGHTAHQSLLAAGEISVHCELYLSTLLLMQDKGGTIDWCRVNPVTLSGPAVTLQKNAPHPNATNLFLEWLFSPQGFVSYDKVTSQGIAFPGFETRQSKVIKESGVNVIVRTEDVELKIIEMGLIERAAKILGAQ